MATVHPAARRAARSRYMPHQGAAERARRLARLERGQIPLREMVDLDCRLRFLNQRIAFAAARRVMA